MSCVALSAAFVLGCSRDIMYGPQGEIVEMKSPKKTLEIEYKKGGKVEIEGARGIGGRSRVRIPPVPVETEGEAMGISDVMVAPPSAPVVPVPPGGERSIEVEQQDVVQ